MPRTVDEILADADLLAKRFETGDLTGAKAVDATPLRELTKAFDDFALAQRRLAEAVATAKAAGHSWAAIGARIGTSGEAARQRYGRPPS
jgi:hypothetical protein